LLHYKTVKKALSIERNPLPADNYTLRSYRIYISPLSALIQIESVEKAFKLEISFVAIPRV